VAMAALGITLPELVELGRWAGSCLSRQEGGVTVEAERADSVIMVDSQSDAGASEDREGSDAGSGSGGGQKDEDNLTESDGEAVAVQGVAVGSDVRTVQLCKLEGCELPVYISQGGVAYEFCSRTHAKRFLHPPQPGELLEETCKLDGCSRRVYVDFDGVPFQFCSKSHGLEHARQQRGPDGDAEQPAGEGEDGDAMPSEFQPGLELQCVREGCSNTIQAPHAGLSS